ncbi:hypothetical protein AcV5_009498 [Taiwanofungus camphoratus]|nr:hypothetical protein AcV5_009498 [Antrodia cinnamomea]
MSETPHLIPFPPVARKGIPWLNRIRGLFHRWILVKFSIRYCKFFNVPREDCIFPLPFNTLLKWTEGTREEEALAMVSARAIGLPVPRMLSYGDHGPGEDGSILMTRVPGQTLNTVLYTLSAAQRETISAELDGLLRRMRMFANPAGTRVSTVDGGAIRSPRVPHLLVAPCADVRVFLETLLSPANPYFWRGNEKRYEEHLANYRRLHEHSYAVVFTHGDLRDHNIMVDGGHVTGIIDWECAGWYPEYWEYTTMLRGPRLPADNLWLQLVQSLSSNTYQTEFDCEWSLWLLTQDGWGH